jgi:tRNA-specific 2-thiouridylase
MEGYRKRFVHLLPVSHTGPLVLLDGELQEGDLELAARLAARFSQGRDAPRVTLEATGLDGETRLLDVIPMPASEIPPDWYI